MRVITFIAIATCTYWILKLSVGKRKGNIQDKPNNYLFYISFAVFFGFLFGVPNWGNKIPGSIFERRSYEGRYYAILHKGHQRDFPEEAQVIIDADVERNGSYDDEIELSASDRVYRLKKLIDKHGRSVSFEDQDKQLSLNKTVTVLKHNDAEDTWQEWGVMLLDIPVD